MQKAEDFFNKYFYFIFIGLGLVVYHKIIFTDPLVDIDYSIVIDPLKDIDSISKYFNLFLTPAIFDIQPIRDLSLKMDLLLESIIAHQVHGFFNVLLWMISCLLARSIFLNIAKNYIANIFTLILFMHPLLAWTLSWPTARKHILAAFFAIWFTRLCFLNLQDGKNRNRQIFITYFLSTLSQPIYFFIAPAYTLLMIVQKRWRENLLLFFALGIWTIAIISLNHFYYESIYIEQSGFTKYQEISNFSFAYKITSFSRYMGQLFLPMYFASTYSSYNLFNFIGLPVAVFYIWILYISCSARVFILLLSGILSTVLLMNINITNIFVSDTYLLFTLFFLVLSLVYIFRRKDGAVLIIILIFFIGKTFYENSISTNSDKFFKVSFEREQSCKNSIAYANYLLKVGRIEEFFEASTYSLNNKCFSGGTGPVGIVEQIYAFRMFLDPVLLNQQKITNLKGFGSKNPRVLALSAILNLEEGKAITPEQSNMFREYKKQFLNDKSLNAIFKNHCENNCKEIYDIILPSGK